MWKPRLNVALRAIAVIVVPLAALCLFGASMWSSVQTHDAVFTTANLRAENAEFALFACREAQLRHVVPRNALVYIEPGPTLETQRAAEFLSGWAPE